MTGVTLPATLNSETVPPWLQSDLSIEEKEKKTDQLFFEVQYVHFSKFLSHYNIAYNKAGD